jgi:hypothetical protein
MESLNTILYVAGLLAFTVIVAITTSSNNELRDRNSIVRPSFLDSPPPYNVGVTEPIQEGRRASRTSISDDLPRATPIPDANAYAYDSTGWIRRGGKTKQKRKPKKLSRRKK